MRYSEAVKRYKLETKQRIFNSILEAAEKENAVSPSVGSYGFYNETNNTDRETKKRETITMRSTQINEVRSRKGGVIAAACAALLIGGGIGLITRSGGIQIEERKVAPASATSTLVASSAADETASGNIEVIVPQETTATAAVTAVSDPEAPQEIVPVDESKPGEVTVSTPETTAPEAKVPAVSGAASFEELLAASDTVFMGMVTDTERQYLEMADGSKKFVIKYTLANGYFTYYINDNELYEYYLTGDNMTVYQYADEATAPQFKRDEPAIFMTSVADTAGYTQSYIADPNGVFSNSDHQIYSISGAGEAISNGMRNYIFNVILNAKDSNTVTSWLMTLGESVDEKEEQRSDLPTNAVIDISWNNEYNVYDVTVNCNPKYSKIKELSSEGGYDISPDGGMTSEKLAGFDGVDIELKEIVYYPDSTAVSLYLEVVPEPGYSFSPEVVYDLDYDFETSGISDISAALNADATMIGDGYFNIYNHSLGFDILFDQAGTDSQMEFDLDSEFTFTINGITASNGQNLTGEYKFKYSYNPIVAEHDKVKIVTRATATNKY